jgi:TAK1-binding protein 2
MDQEQNSLSTDFETNINKHIDNNNNHKNSKTEISKKVSDTNKSKCSCTNISIMQLFHEMKQEFPKVPDQIVQQLVTDHCHNRRACIDQLRQATISAAPTNTMYPSKSIHNNDQTIRSPLFAAKWSNNQKIKDIIEKKESATCSSEAKLFRPTTLKLRRAPDPPHIVNNNDKKSQTITSTLSSSSSTTTSISNLNSMSSSSPPNTIVYQPDAQQMNNIHHNVKLDSSAIKYSDSLNVQLNVTVSPVSDPPPIPPRSLVKPARHLTQLSMQPEPAFTSILEQKSAPVGGTSISSGTSGQRSYTSVNFALRQPSSILPLPITPIDIQAGPSSLTYSSSSFDAKQGYQSHLTITVAGNGESCIQAVRSKQPSDNNLPELSQIDTTISVGKGTEMTTDCEPIRITTNNQQKLPITEPLMTDGKLQFAFFSPISH